MAKKKVILLTLTPLQETILREAISHELSQKNFNSSSVGNLLKKIEASLKTERAPIAGICCVCDNVITHAEDWDFEGSGSLRQAHTTCIQEN